MTEEEYIAHYAKKHIDKTVKEVADHLEVKEQRVRYICKLHGIVLMSPRQRKRNFIIENYYKMGKREMADHLVISYGTLIDLIKEEGIRDIVAKDKCEEETDMTGEEKKIYESLEERIDRELIEAAKQVLREPNAYGDTQLKIAQHVRRSKPSYFIGI